jgi:hypothetical protein
VAYPSRKRVGFCEISNYEEIPFGSQVYGWTPPAVLVSILWRRSPLRIKPHVKRGPAPLRISPPIHTGLSSQASKRKKRRKHRRALSDGSEAWKVLSSPEWAGWGNIRWRMEFLADRGVHSSVADGSVVHIKRLTDNPSFRPQYRFRIRRLKDAVNGNQRKTDRRRAARLDCAGRRIRPNWSWLQTDRSLVFATSIRHRPRRTNSADPLPNSPIPFSV